MQKIKSLRDVLAGLSSSTGIALNVTVNALVTSSHKRSTRIGRLSESPQGAVMDMEKLYQATF